MTQAAFEGVPSGGGLMAEPTFNVALAEALARQRAAWRDHPDRVSCQRTRVVEGARGRVIDILVSSPDSFPVAVEIEWGDPAEADARGRLGLRVEGSPNPVRSAVAVGAPPEARAWTQPRLERALAAPGGLTMRFAVLYDDGGGAASRWPEDRHVTGSVSDLAVLCEYAAAPPGVVERTAGEVAERIRSIATNLERRLHPQTARAVARHVGQRNTLQGLRLACCIWLTSLRLQDQLAERSGALRRGPSAGRLRSVSRVRDEDGVLTPTAIRGEWAKILSVNYGAIFRTARAAFDPDIPVDAAADTLRALAELSETIGARRLGDRIDFAGELFPLLLDDREETAAHYTLPETAELLAGLAMDRVAADWSDAAGLARLRVADMACGTGGLLRAAYGHLRRRHEAAGGRGGGLHAALIQEGLTGIDINTLATHMTAAGLSAFDIAAEYHRSNIVAADVTRAATATGSLELLAGSQIADMFGQTMTAADATRRGRPANITVADGSQDVVIQNPPYQRPRKDRALFDVAGSTPRSRARSTRRLGALRAALRRGNGDNGRTQAGRMVDGQAGLGADFSALAHLKLRPGGVLATVLPLTAAHAPTWRGFRRTIEERYGNVTVVAGPSMSADTHMREMLLIAVKSANGEPAPERTGILCVNLHRSPRSLTEAFWLRKLIADVEREPGPAGVIRLDRRIGSWTRAAALRPGFPWFAAGMSNHELAAVLARLFAGALWSPSEQREWAIPLPFTTLGRAAEVGPTHDSIGHLRGGDGRGAFTFDPIEAGDAPALPALWAADARAQRRMAVRPTHDGTPIGGDEAVRAMVARRGDLFVSRTLRMTTQALAAARTDGPAMGGRAWTALLGGDDAVRSALALWLNSTLGLLTRTGYAQTTQPGRATLSIGAIEEFPVPDFAAPTPAGDHARAAASAAFPRLAALDLLPAARAWQDERRREVDLAALDMIGLGGDGAAARALDWLRRAWCREPDVHGGAGAIVRDLGLTEDAETA